jgi:hypothetical protein
MASSSTFSGSAVAASMGSAFTALVDQAEIALDDTGNSKWTTTEIGTFLNDAIRDYSQHFPRRLNTTINCSADDREYDLPADFQSPLSVEYPAGEDPAEYLVRAPHTWPGFWDRQDRYDIVRRNDGGDRSEIWISRKPTGSQTIIVHYHGDHEYIADVTSISGNSSVRLHHEQILIKYILWQATVQLQIKEQQSPTSNSSLLMSQFAQNARRLQVTYETAIRQALFANDGRSQPVDWTHFEQVQQRIY